MQDDRFLRNRFDPGRQPYVVDIERSRGVRRTLLDQKAGQPGRRCRPQIRKRDRNLFPCAGRIQDVSAPYFDASSGAERISSAP